MINKGKEIEVFLEKLPSRGRLRFFLFFVFISFFFWTSTKLSKTYTLEQSFSINWNDIPEGIIISDKEYKLNTSIKASGIDIKAAELRLKQAKGGYYPSFDLTANYGHEHINKRGAGNNTQLVARDATAKLTQTITDFGLTASTVKTSKLSLKQSRALEKQVKNDILLSSLILLILCLPQPLNT